MEQQPTPPVEAFRSLKVSLLICRSDGTVDEVLSRQSGDELTFSAGQHFFGLIPEDDREDFIEAWNNLTATSPDLDTALRFSFGELQTWFRVRVSLLNDERRRVILMLPADASIRRELEQTAHWRAVLDTAVDAIITIDSQGTILTVNVAASEMFGYPVDALLNQNISILMPEPYRSEHNGYLQEYIRTGKAAIVGIGRKVTAICSDGTELPVHLAVSAFDVNGQKRFTGIIRDLSELDSVQQQLLQSERLAAIGQMVTGLAHESRNALQRAQAHLDMLSLDLEEMPEQLDLAQRSKHALQDLHRLYEEVKGYAAPIQLEYRPVRLTTIWRKVWAHLESERAEKQINLKETPECDELQVEVDIHRMEQVFRNIMENSIHACSEKGCITISYAPDRLHRVDAVRINIQDDGHGLTTEAAQHLFDPFFTTKQKGTGLGLAIVERIILAHGGMISATALQPHGTIISIVLPSKAISRNGVR
ncbi:MAG: PAS domain S-box protein [Planctomycetaceae bacterium]|nr:PAS domain S-box protein [Planctomycetaceae bacterium]